MGYLRYNQCKVPTHSSPLKRKLQAPQAKIDILGLARELYF
jgi:hypothetical protein